MKCIIFACIICLMAFFQACNSKKETLKDSYKIKGSIQNFDSTGWVWLEKNVAGKFVRSDSARVGSNGIFELEGPCLHPDACLLNIGNQRKYPFIINNEFTELEADFKANNLKLISGSKDNMILQQVVLVESGFAKQADTLRKMYENAGKNSLQTLQDSIVTVFDSLQNRYVKVLAYTADTLPASLVHAYMLFNLDIKNYMDIWKDKLSVLKTKYPQVSLINQAVQLLEKNEKISTRLAIGAIAPEINLPDIKGRNIALSSLKGSVVLIDFWASWCGPCRAENPNVVKLYKKYSPKGLKIYGVSLDNSKDKWLQAIETDKLTWLHVSDLKGWQSEAAVTYNIESIPATVLINKDGTIAARNLRGQPLYDKIAELCK